MEFFGSKIVVTENVVYVGEGDDPADNPIFQSYARAVKEVYGQPERSKREDTDFKLGAQCSINEEACDSCQ